MRIPDSSRASHEVRKVPQADLVARVTPRKAACDLLQTEPEDRCGVMEFQASEPFPPKSAVNDA